jgi:UDP-GlcNAc:undecaprenyl-phosphate GlcNAc-1-phosphate transferase
LPAVSSALLAGMCIGFLPHNFYPARIFMGDTGAMLLGLLLAYGPISSTESLDPSLLSNYTQYHVVNRYGTILPLLVPAAIFLVPYADLMLAVIRRTRRGKPVMAADREHLHHRLLGIGHSYRQSVLIMWLWAALFSSAVVSLSLVRTRLWVLAAVTVFAVLTLLPVTMPRLRPWRLFSATRPDVGPGAAEGRGVGVAGRGVAGRGVAGRGVAGRGVAPAAGRGGAPAAGEVGIPAVAAPGTAARAAANGRRAAHARRPAPSANAATNGSAGSGSARDASTGNRGAGGNGAGNGSVGGNGRIPGPGPAERALRPFPADADSAASGPDRVTGIPQTSDPLHASGSPRASDAPRASDQPRISDSTRVAGSGRVVRRLFDDQFADTEPFPAPPNPDARPR